MQSRRYFPYVQLSDGHANYIKALIKDAGKMDPNHKIFGSSTHKYKLNPPITLAEVKDFESRFHLTLPEEYVFFLTRVGNGGAGPYHGLYPLEDLPKYTEYLGVYDDSDVSGLPAFIDRDLGENDWAQAMKDAEQADDDEYDAKMKQLCSGLLVIGTQGCTYDNLLMWKGSETGKMVYIDWNLDPEYAPFLTGLTFLEWYEHFFLEILAGHHLTSYGYTSLKTEQELRQEYTDSTLTEDKLRILSSFHGFAAVEPETIQLLSEWDRPETDGVKTELLFKLSPAKGLEKFEQIIVGNHPQGAIYSARRMPDQYKDRFYHKMVRMLYRPDLRDKTKILFFLGDCSCRKASDLTAFAENPANSGEDRRTAVYVIGTCPDKHTCIKFLAGLMQADTGNRNDAYWLAHAALQAMSRTPCPELLDTFDWMWKKYENDDMMRSNLKIALKTNGIVRY